MLVKTALVLLVICDCARGWFASAHLLFVASCLFVAAACRELKINSVEEINGATGKQACVRIKGERTVTTTNDELVIAQDLTWAARSVNNPKYTKSKAKEEFTAEFQKCINALKAVTREKTKKIKMSKLLSGGELWTIEEPSACGHFVDMWKISA